MADRVRGVKCPKCQQVIFGRDQDGCTVTTSAEQEKKMATGRFVCPTEGCGQKIEMQGPGGYKKASWVPVDEFTQR